MSLATGNCTIRPLDLIRLFLWCGCHGASSKRTPKSSRCSKSTRHAIRALLGRSWLVLPRIVPPQIHGAEEPEGNTSYAC
ncbi:hypothetical protein F4813DRAFT_375773 [Daldinia decipiens]|uniref:uncharacterized protein n=1 Tax=Daldinia decipiens TaxID=326647 RepID=UPI0020C2142B|nr:uncharacterized protein F4813DRAFT_375773 [Daldinia decipiens]KAI1653075.1 hypothetical protein F4813DRAFT_375773 [Daldinia decipiens]